MRIPCLPATLNTTWKESKKRENTTQMLKKNGIGLKWGQSAGSVA